MAECWLDPNIFLPRLDFAIREWARRSDAVRREVDQADTVRIDAIATMFARHGYEATDAFIGRIMYCTQIGYYALDVSEPIHTRLAYARAYLVGFGGIDPQPDDMIEFEAFVARVQASTALS